MGKLRILVMVIALGGGLLQPGMAQADSEFTYVTVRDGVKIAVQVFYPPGFSEPNRTWPAVLEMDGYSGASGAGGTRGFQDEYVVIRASARGTGCSGGKFDLLSWRTAQDGHDIIEDWIVQQPWSNRKVAVVGHSYPGLTGFQIAATNPPHLSAVAVSGLIDDFYRGIFYMGGVPNAGFPLIWEGAYRPATDAQATWQRLASEDGQCRANLEERGTWNFIQHENIAEAYLQREATEESWHIRNAPMRFIDQVTAPIQLEHQYQDEQTGPRGGPVLYERLPEGVPKRLVLSNGFHNHVHGVKKEWIDCWLLQEGEDCGAVNDPTKSVRVHFETRIPEGGAREANPAYDAAAFPLPETRWTRYYLGSNGELLRDRQAGDGTVSYLSAPTGRQTTGSFGIGGAVQPLAEVAFAEGPDTLRYELDFEEATAIVGPMALTLWLSSTAPDTDVFVDLLDVDTATGATTYVQRGLLRASHRAVDLEVSDRIRGGPWDGQVYRYWHPHVDPEPLTPLGPHRLEIEINPAGHVFREGHKLVMLVHSPPASDPYSLYAWTPEQPVARNTIHQGPDTPSSLLLPVLPVLPPIQEAKPACGELAGQPCW